jgi:large subunit ribosomal protein L10
MALMKAPVQKLAATINEVPSKLVRTLAAIRDAKQAA